jgi:hypothetical protein
MDPRTLLFLSTLSLSLQLSSQRRQITLQGFNLYGCSWVDQAMMPLSASIQTTKSSSAEGAVVPMILVTKADLAAILAKDNSESLRN